MFFSDYFDVDRSALDLDGALEVNLVTDLPLFVDPFLLFNSNKKPYQELHERVMTTCGT